MKNAILIILAVVLLASCERVFLGEETENTPEHNFELFWQDFDEHYGLFVAREWDWDSIYTVYRPQVTPETTDDELWESFKAMIDYLDDGHTVLVSPGQKFAISGATEWEAISEELSLDLIKEKYVNDKNDVLLGGEASFYGSLKDKDIGYIYLDIIESNKPELMDDILREVGEHKAIILDVRSNNGGDDITAKKIAARFADGEHLICTAQERNGPKHDDFSEKIPYYSEVSGEEHFSKPVILLTDGRTVSAGETFVWYMKAFEMVTQMGTTTTGDFSYTSNIRYLPNGWLYQYSTMMYLTPDGQALDGIGHIPDVYSRNTATDIEAGQDKVMERAIQYLFEEYGIE